MGGRAIHPINVRVGGFYRAAGPGTSCGRFRPVHGSRRWTTRWRPCAPSPGSRSRTSSSPTPTCRCAARTATRSSPAPCLTSTGTQLRRGALRRARGRAARRALQRAARLAARQPDRTSSGRWPGTRSTTTSSPTWPRRPPPAAGLGTDAAATRSGPSSSGPWSWWRPARSPCGSSTSWRGAPAARGAGAAARRGRLRRQRGAARPARPPLPARRGRHDRGRGDHAADVAEPAEHRGGPARLRPGAAATCPTRS